jgi:hypothetical protein
MSNVWEKQGEEEGEEDDRTGHAGKMRPWEGLLDGISRVKLDQPTCTALKEKQTNDVDFSVCEEVSWIRSN